MPNFNVTTSFNVDVEFQLPGFGKRLLSWSLDVLFQYLYLILVFRLGKIFEGSFSFLDHGWLFYTLLFLPISMYHLLMEVFSNGQSFGKKITGIRVVNMLGGRPGFSQLMIRWLLRISDVWIALILLMLLSNSTKSLESIMVLVFGIIFLLVDFLLVSVGKKSQRVGDILANTLVINTSSISNLDETIFMEIEESYKPMFPEVMRISDKDLNVIKSALNNNKWVTKNKTLESIANRVKGYLNINTQMDDAAFLQRLIKDYNHLSSK